MAAFGYAFTSKIRKDAVQIVIESASELFAEATAAITSLGKSQPVLFDLRKAIPRIDQSRRNLLADGLVLQKGQVLNDSVVKLSVSRLPTVEQQERIYKQR